MYTSRERQYTALINIFRALGHALIGSGWVPAFEKTKKKKHAWHYWATVDAEKIRRKFRQRFRLVTGQN